MVYIRGHSKPKSSSTFHFDQITDGWISHILCVKHWPNKNFVKTWSVIYLLHTGSHSMVRNPKCWICFFFINSLPRWAGIGTCTRWRWPRIMGGPMGGSIVASFGLFAHLNVTLENFIVRIASQGSIDASIAAYTKHKENSIKKSRIKC